MAGFLSYFLPKDKVFYTLFEDASNNLQMIAEKLVQVVHESDYNKREEIIQEMRDIEHKNDDITHVIFVELGRNFITPFDREDIHSLATALDDVADFIYAAGKKINFYKIDPLHDEGVQKSAEAILQAVIALKQAVMELRNLKNTQKIIDCIIKINSAENSADVIFDSSIERLFDSDVDAKELIKRRELYMVLETATDKCEDAGNVIESIVVKFA
jgi:predicted phosphate transport protein (TIGR00153 family)